MRVETPMVWIPSRARSGMARGGGASGRLSVVGHTGGRAVTKQFSVSDRVGWRTPERLESGVVNQLLYPAEAPIDSDVPIEAIYVSYPERAVNLLGWETHWMIAFFLLSIVFAFALKKRFGVVI